jgi:hypothetical protein
MVLVVAAVVQPRLVPTTVVVVVKQQIELQAL